MLLSFFVSLTKKPSLLDDSIKQLMKFLRDEFPEASITPKLHLLEDHVISFIKKWKFGLGMYAEQGAESIHPVFNKLHATYGSVRPDCARLKAMLEHHHLEVKPVVKNRIPAVKRRKVMITNEE